MTATVPIRVRIWIHMRKEGLGLFITCVVQESVRVCQIINHARIVGEITFTDSHLLYSRICFKPDTFFMQIGVELIPAYCLN